MKILRIVAAGALSYFAYKALTKRAGQSESRDDAPETGAISDARTGGSDNRGGARGAVADDRLRTTPHGDPLAEELIEDDADIGGSPQSSRGFGES